MSPTFAPVTWPDDAAAIIGFLVDNDWPFHGTTRLTRDQAAAISISDDDVASFWIRSGGTTIGLIRVFDLSDLDTGSPLFDLRALEWLSTPETGGSSGNVGDVEGGDHQPLTERQGEFLEV
jgi:hypothetical protein